MNLDIQTFFVVEKPRHNVETEWNNMDYEDGG